MKTQYRILATLLTLCMLLMMLPTAVFAADQVATGAGARIIEEEYDSTTGVLSVEVQVKVPNSTGIKSIGSMITYDSSKLTLLHKNSNDTSYTPTTTKTARKTAVAVNLMDVNEDLYTIANADLYGTGNRAALFVGLGSIEEPLDTQKTTDWLTIYLLRFKVNGDPETVLNSDSLRVADPALDGDVIKGAFPANDDYVISLNTGDNTNYKYGKMSDNTSGDLTGNNYAMAASKVTATYTGSDNVPPKETPTITTVPTASAITYGQTLADSTLSSGVASVAGAFAWKTSDTAPAVSDSNVTEYDVVFTPTDTAHYNTAECKVKLTVNPKTLTDVAIGDIDDQEYTGSQIKPAATVTGDSGKTLVADTDYTVSYGTNIAVGTGSGSVTVTAKSGSNYTFTPDVTKNFNIVAAASTISITGDASKTYDGTAVTDPAVDKTGSTGAVTYVYYTDAECTTQTTTANGAASDGAAPKNAGTYYVKATVAADANYGSKTSDAKAFTIAPKALTDAMVELGTNPTYNAASQSITVTVTDGSALTKDTDYTLSGTTALTDVAASDVTISVVGAGNYSGTINKTWNLNKVALTLPSAAVTGKTYDGTTDATITGGALSGIIGTDEVSLVSDSISGTFASATVGTGIAVDTANAFELTGAKAGNYTLTQPTGLTGEITAATQVITVPAEAQNVPFNSTLNLNTICSSNDSTATLTYTLTGTLPAGTVFNGGAGSVTAATTEGTFTVKVSSAATANYTAAADKTITINIVALPAATIDTPPTAKTGLVYNGEDQELVTAGSGVTGGTLNYKVGSGAYAETLPVGLDAGTYTVYYKVIGNATTHGDSAEQSFDVTIAPKEVTVAAGTYKVSKAFDGTTSVGTGTGELSVEGICAADSVTVAATPVAYTDANVGGQTSMDVGIALDGTGKENYKIKDDATTLSVPCEITPKEITITSATATDRSYVSNDSSVEISDVTFSGALATLVKGTDFTVTGAMANADAGTGKSVTATVTLLNDNYTLATATATTTVNIAKASALTIADIPVSQKYSQTAEQSKDLSDVMPEDAGVTGYTAGAATATGSAVVSGYSIDAAGLAKYTITDGVIGDEITLPVTVASTNYEDTSFNVVITLTDKDPQATLTVTSATSVTYGSTLNLTAAGGSGTGAVTFAVTDGTGSATITGNVLTPTKAGTVTVTATKAADVNYSEASSLPVVITIAKATPTGTPTYTDIVAGNKTLADANLTIGSITPAGGTITWDAGDAQIVAPNTTYTWTYTPAAADRDNYNTLTGSIVPYVLYMEDSAYAINVSTGKNGTINVRPTVAIEDTTVTITTRPSKGFTLETLTVTTADGKKVELTNKGNGVYTFDMPDSKVTIAATFMEDNSMLNFFVDVTARDYYYDAVLWAAKSGLTKGVDSVHFDPAGVTTRAQLITMLWREAGEPIVNYAMSFTDVPANEWYTEAVRWAASEGITTGTSETTFSPDDIVTRAQIVTLLWRYAGAPAFLNMTANGPAPSPFKDVDNDAYYYSAVMWAVGQGITTGTGNGFQPDDLCNRAQMVTFLYRYFA